VEEAAAKVRDGSVRDLVDGATDFAKRQPAAFLGLSVLAGFAAVRFLKASGGSSPPQRTGSEARGSAARNEFSSEGSGSQASNGTTGQRRSPTPGEGGAS
jgi:hypothetical protein